VDYIDLFVNDGQLVCCELDKYAEVICISSLSPVLLSSNVVQTAGKKLVTKINRGKIMQGLCKVIDMVL